MNHLCIMRLLSVRLGHYGLAVVQQEPGDGGKRLRNLLDPQGQAERLAAFGSKQRPMNVALIYALFGVAWITFTDVLVETLMADLIDVTMAQTIKGLLYISITTAFIYWLARRAHRYLQAEMLEDELRLTESFVSTLLAGMGDAVILLDPETDRILRVNPAAQQMFGLDHKELVEKTCESLFESQAAYRQFIEKTSVGINAGNVVRLNQQLRNASGEVLHAELTVSAMPAESPLYAGNVVIIRDTTTRVEAQRDLEDTSLKLNAALAAGRTGLWDWQIDTDTVTYSAEWARELGLEDNGESRATWHQRIHPEDASRIDTTIDAALARGDEQVQFEYRFRHRDGTYRWSLTHAAIVRDDDGRPVRMLGSATDISDLRQAQDARLEIAEQLRQVQKLESVGQFAGGIAHDFNNKLSVVLGAAQLAMLQINDPKITRERLQDIHAAGEAAAALARQLLTFASRQPIDPEIVNLNDLVASMLRMLERLIGEHMKLEWQPSPELGLVHIDPGQIDQILANLVINSRDAIGEAGTITIRTHNVDVAGSDPRLPADAEGGPFVVLCVSDSGCGMSAETRARIFEPFYTTKPVGQGTGLGLSTVYGIVTQNHGFIDIDSRPGVGTHFSVYLRRSKAEVVSATSGERDPLYMRQGSETILVVEDEQAVLDMLRIMLEASGYHVVATNDPTQAMALAEELERPPDLLLTDVVMPRMNGLELADLIRERWPEMRILCISGYSDKLVAEHGGDAEDLPVLLKPLSLRALGDKLREVLDSPATH